MKDITLEMVDKFIEETGFDYEEARAYLLAADGDLDLAIEAATAKEGPYSRSSLDSFLAYVKELVKKGNLLRVIVKKNNEVLLNIPVGVGVVGAVFATYFSAAALAVALMTGHSVTLEKKDGEIINVQDYLDKAVKKVKESGDELGEMVKKGVKESKDFAHELKENIEEKISEVKEKGEHKKEEIHEDLEEFKENVEEQLKQETEKLKEKIEEISEEVQEEVVETVEELKEKNEDVE